MIGTGVFSSLFFQVGGLPSGSAILILWLCGGLVALCGALCYAELAGLFPRSGGEYEYLSKIYHPALGFAAGICSLIVGFAAPMAGAALNLGNYFAPVLGVAKDAPECKYIALAGVALVTGIQLLGVRAGGIFQNIATILKIALILLFITLPFILPEAPVSTVSFDWDENTWGLITSGAFFSSLAMLYYAYSGWNASIYIASNLENPKKNLPLSILLGTVSVTILYLALNFVFLYVCNLDEISAGGPSLGNTVAAKLFGTNVIGSFKIVDIFSVLFSIALIATLNSGMITSPRVAETLGEDYPIFQVFTKELPNGSPYIAVITMGVLTSIFTVFSSIKSILDFVGFSLAIFGSLVVIGLLIMRFRTPNADRPFKTWGYPITPIVFLVINGAMMYYTIQFMHEGSAMPLFASIYIILLGVGLHPWVQLLQTKYNKNSQ